MGGKKKSRGGKEAAWVGKYRVLVKARGRGRRSEFFVVDLKQDKVVMEHPGAVWSDNTFISTAVVRKGTVTVLNVGADEFHNLLSLTVNEQHDHVHTTSDTSTATLDLTVTPPKWSPWTAAPKMIYKRYLPFWAALGDKVFVFWGSYFHSDKAELCGVGSKWEEITVPFDGYVTAGVISDPSKGRLVAYFGKQDALYAYYPNRNKWELIHQPVRGTYFCRCVVANQVVANIIYFFHPTSIVFIAYDILTNKWLKVELSSPFPPDHQIVFEAVTELVYLGNDMLCLAGSYSSSSHTAIHFLRFSVRRVQDYVQLTPVSFHPIYIRPHCLADTFIPF